MKHENLVLSNELKKVELPPRKIWTVGASSVSPSTERTEELRTGWIWEPVTIKDREDQLLKIRCCVLAFPQEQEVINPTC